MRALGFEPKKEEIRKVRGNGSCYSILKDLAYSADLLHGW